MMTHAEESSPWLADRAVQAYDTHVKITSPRSDNTYKKPSKIRNYASHSRGRSFIRSHYMDSTEASRSRSRSISPLHPSHDIHPNHHRHNKIPSRPKVIKSIGLSKSHPNSEAFKRGLYYDTSTQKMRWSRSHSSSTSPRGSRSRSQEVPECLATLPTEARPFYLGGKNKSGSRVDSKNTPTKNKNNFSLQERNYDTFGQSGDPIEDAQHKLSAWRNLQALKKGLRRSQHKHFMDSTVSSRSRDGSPDPTGKILKGSLQNRAVNFDENSSNSSPEIANQGADSVVDERFPEPKWRSLSPHLRHGGFQYRNNNPLEPHMAG